MSQQHDRYSTGGGDGAVLGARSTGMSPPPSLRRICSDGAAGSGSGDVSWLVAAYSTRASSFLRHGAPQGSSLDQTGEVAGSRKDAEAVKRRSIRRASSTSSSQEHQSGGRGGGVAAAFARARQVLRSLSFGSKPSGSGGSDNSSSRPVAIRQGTRQQPSGRSGSRRANSLPHTQLSLLASSPGSEPASPRTLPSTVTSASLLGSASHSRGCLVDGRRGPHSSACLPPGPGEPAPSRQLRPALSSRQLLASSSFGSSGGGSGLSSSLPPGSSLGSGSVLSGQSSGCLGSPKGGSVWDPSGEQRGDEALPATSQALELLYKHAEARKGEIRRQTSLPVA